MKYNQLQASKKKDSKRVGRGISAGQGKTAGRGTKGQKARTGHSRMRATFMGGQRSIMQAVPKLKGFKSIHQKAEVVYTDNLNGLKETVDNFALANHNLISSPYVRTKILKRGEITTKITLSTQFASQAAIAAIKAAGGNFTKITVPKRPKSEK
jgi:large subunit ribosomal protein L15